MPGMSAVKIRLAPFGFIVQQFFKLLPDGARIIEHILSKLGFPLIKKALGGLLFKEHLFNQISHLRDHCIVAVMIAVKAPHSARPSLES